MKVLLLGEFSRLHNSLKEGLLANGHEVVLAGSGDSFKNYPVDINIGATIIRSNYILTFVRHAIFKISGFDITSIEIYLRFKYSIKNLSSFDAVQLINECSFNTSPVIERKLVTNVFKHNSNVYILACGDDYTFISYLLSRSFPHSTLTPYLKKYNLKKKYIHTLKYITPAYKRISEFVRKHSKGFIPVSVEYVQAYEGKKKVLPMIPNPINIDKIAYSKPLDTTVIKIFHGINTHNFLKKGNQYFINALEIIRKTYTSRIKIVTVQDEPYSSYITQLEQCHIILDQVYAHDQGYNALEAMAMGKVVFTGAGDYFINHYNLTQEVAINTTPNVGEIVRNLKRCIDNPSLIQQIGKNARIFIEQHHDYRKIASMYVDTWLNN